MTPTACPHSWGKARRLRKPTQTLMVLIFALGFRDRLGPLKSFGQPLGICKPASGCWLAHASMLRAMQDGQPPRRPRVNSAEGGLITAWTGLWPSRACPAQQPVHCALRLGVARVWLDDPVSGVQRPAAQIGSFRSRHRPADVPDACRRACDEQELGHLRLAEEGRESRKCRSDGVWSGRAPGARTRNLRIKSPQLCQLS